MPDSLHQITVREVMHRGVITCGSATSLKEVARTMNATDVHAIFVVDEQEHVIGVISHMDMLRAFGQDLHTLQAKDMMSPLVHSVSPQDTVAAAVELMLQNRVHRLLVAQEEQGHKIPLGIVSTTDVIDAMWGRPWLWGRPESKREIE